jgi:hypothetical protein
MDDKLKYIQCSSHFCTFRRPTVWLFLVASGGGLMVESKNLSMGASYTPLFTSPFDSLTKILFGWSVTLLLFRLSTRSKLILCTDIAELKMASLNCLIIHDLIATTQSRYSS